MRNIKNVDEKIYNILDYPINNIVIDFSDPKRHQNELGNITTLIGDECPVAKEFGISGIGEGCVWISNVLKISRNKDILSVGHTIISEELTKLISENIKTDGVFYFSFNNLHLVCIDLNIDIIIKNPLMIKELMILSSQISFKVKDSRHSVSKTKTLAPVDVEKLNTIQEFVDYSVTRVRFEQGLKEVFSSPEEYDTKRTGDILRWIVNDIMSEEMDVLVGNDLTPKDVNKYISTKAREMFFKEIGI